MTSSTLTEAQLDLRQQVLLLLFKNFGDGKYSINLSTNVLMIGAVSK